MCEHGKRMMRQLRERHQKLNNNKIKYELMLENEIANHEAMKKEKSVRHYSKI